MKKLATQGRITRPSLGIFGSLSSHILTRYTDIGDNLNLQAQSIFRSVTLVQPDTKVVMGMILKSEGYGSHQKLSQLTERFIKEFTI